MKLKGVFPIPNALQASTISKTDCVIRRGEFVDSGSYLPSTPGVDFVGRIYRIDKKTAKKYGLAKGMIVTSLMKRGGNSRFVSVDPAFLVVVPDKLDPAVAVCLPEAYLSAFQILHHGQSPGSRYTSRSLKGKAIFINGVVTSNLGRAISQLAAEAGIEAVYATTKPKYVQNLLEMGIVPLSPDPVDWWEDLTGSIDIFISIGEKVLPLHYKLLKTTGQLLITGHGSESLDPDNSKISSRVACSKLRSQRGSKTHLYDVFDNWNTNTQQCQKDLTFLLGLLQGRRIRPVVLERIPLTKVARAQELVEHKRPSGFLVCEPWLVSKSRSITL